MVNEASHASELHISPFAPIHVQLKAEICRSVFA